MKETVLITGANRGIGLALAREFAAHNWQVLACCRRPADARELQQLAARHTGAVEVFPLDVRDQQQIDALAARLRERPIDILLNNAGVGGPKNHGFGPVDLDSWLDTLRVNTIAPLQMAVAFVDHVAGSGRKIIATLGSQLGCIGDNTYGNLYAYRASKAAVHMVMKNLAIDLHDRGITAVALHPGWVRTEIGGPKAPLNAAESAVGLYRVLTSLSQEGTGELWTYDGRVLPW